MKNSVLRLPKNKEKNEMGNEIFEAKYYFCRSQVL